MQTRFMIEKEKTSLEQSINSLYEIANTALGMRVNKIAVIFTWISSILAVAALVHSIFFNSGVILQDANAPNPSWGSAAEWILIIALIVLIILVWVVIGIRNRKRD